MTYDRNNKYVKQTIHCVYKDWLITWTGISAGGINTYVAKKEGCPNIGATSIKYLKKVIDYESGNEAINT